MHAVASARHDVETYIETVKQEQGWKSLTFQAVGRKGRQKHVIQVPKSELGDSTVPSTFTAVSQTARLLRFTTPTFLSLINPLELALEALDQRRTFAVLGMLQRFAVVSFVLMLTIRSAPVAFLPTMMGWS